MIAQSPGGLDVGRAVAITEQLAATLDAAHRSGRVHANLRPDNVWVFGEAARIDDAHLRPATPGVDARADVYGLGALLFAMLTGRGPFQGGPARAVDLRPDLPPAFEPVFARALAVQPQDRYATTSELAQAARTAASGGYVAPPPPPSTWTGAAAPAPPAAAAKSQARLAWALGGFAAIALVAAVIAAVLLIAGSGGDDDSTTTSAQPPPTTTAPGAPVENPIASDPAAGPAIPAVAERDLEAAVAAGGCRLSSPPEEGKDHSANEADWVYKSNPPTSGTHAPTWAEDGVYTFGSAPKVGFTTHALEHGRINIQYGPKLTEPQFNQLQTLMTEDEGYHQLLFSNQTNMPGTLAAAAWTKLLTCPTFNPKVFDALRAFKKSYTDKAPEQVP